MTDELIIETRGLKKTFVSRNRGKKREVEAVKGVDLAVKKGEIFGFLGPNGAGKSTTQKMLSTLLPPTGGEGKVAGFDLQREQSQIRKNIGYVSQAGGTDSGATGYENLILQAQLYGIDDKTAKRQAEELVRRFQMDSFADRPASTYSGGQKRRLDVALGMTHRPQLLLLDEPTTGLDPQSMVYMWEEIKKLKADGVSIFLTTHYMEEADHLCDTIAIIDDGIIIVEGTPAELKNSIGADIVVLGFSDESVARKSERLLLERFHPEEMAVEEDFVRLHIKDGDRAIPELLRLLDANNVEAQNITLSKPSLDDVFLKYTGRSLREDNK
ncbi:MAG: ATP-binding cassette domain-containing protein [Candidatus Cryosericum sp.]